MFEIRDKSVLVLGLGISGRSACELLLRRGARVTVLDEAPDQTLGPLADHWRRKGVTVHLGPKTTLPETAFDLAVTSPAFVPHHAWLRGLDKREIPVISELELGYEHSYCLNVSVTGTNGKTTTTGMIERSLALNQYKTLLAGSNGVPLTSVAEQSRELDFLVLEVNSLCLERTRFFRPAVAVILNITSDHVDRYGGMNDYVRAKARLVANQQAFDWAIVQSEVLARFQTMDIPIPSKVITFSAHNRRADIHLDRGLLISRIEGWTGRLLDMDHCQLRGPHHAENFMAALAVGRVLRIPLEAMKEPLQSFTSPPHRCEFVEELAGVRYINDAKSTNVDALQKALLSLPAGSGDEPNVWLIAGGREKGADYHDVGPLLSQRVKETFLIGEAREKLRAAWSLFTPCTLVDSLLEAVQVAARKAKAGDTVLLSPACSSLDQFENYQHRGEVFRQAVKELTRRAVEDTNPTHVRDTR